jgi:hypothetical protein
MKSGTPDRAENVSLEAAPKLLAAKGVEPVLFSDWKKLDALERANGAKAGKIREKFTRVEDMLAAALKTAV